MFLEYFHLREQPFGVTPDPRFVLPTPVYQEALASLQYGVETGRGFMALIAPPGMGKTTVLMEVLEWLEGRSQSAFIFQTQCGSRELLRALISELGGEGTSTSDLVELHTTLEEILLREFRRASAPVLIIDEAQNLDDCALETVRLLSDFETPRAKLVQIILAGQLELSEKLSASHMAQLRQRISIHARLAPLTTPQVRNYIEQRLSIAGYSGAPLFSDEAYRSIAALSGGIPRDVSNICFNALSLACALNHERVDMDILKQVAEDLDWDTMVSSATEAEDLPRTDAGKYGRGERVHSAEPWSSVMTGAHTDVQAPVASVGSAHVGAAHADEFARELRGAAGEQSNAGAAARYFAPSSNSTPDHLPIGVGDSDATSGCNDGYPKPDRAGAVRNENLFDDDPLHALRSAGRATSEKPASPTRARVAALCVGFVVVVVAVVVAATMGSRLLFHAAPLDLRSRASQAIQYVEYGSAGPPVKRDKNNAEKPDNPTEPTRSPIQATRARHSAAPPLTVRPKPNATVSAAAAGAPATSTPATPGGGLGAGAMGTDATSQPAAERSAASSAIDSAAPKEPRTAAELPPASVNDTGLIANGKVPANLPADPALNVTPTMVPQPTSSSAAGPGALDYFVQPVYPPIARAAAVQGQVVLSALIGKDGRVIKVRVVDGSALLAQAALDAVKQWRYRPSYMNGEPIEIERKVTVDFSLPR